jgi:hypothetical protein
MCSMRMVECKIRYYKTFKFLVMKKTTYAVIITIQINGLKKFKISSFTPSETVYNRLKGS